MVETHRVRSPEERRKLELARRRYARRFKKIEDLKRRGPQFIMVLLSLLALSLILYRLFGPELLRQENEDISDTFAPTAVDAAVSGVRTDPEPLRSEIESFERALLGGESASNLDELRSTISAEASVLSERIRQLSAEQPALVDLGERFQSLLIDVQTSSLELEKLADLREEWVDLRDSALRKASWFTAPPKGAFAQDTSFLIAYRQSADSLLSLVDLARSEAESFSEMVADGEPIQESWREFERDFTEQLRDIERSIPAERPGVKASTQLLSAIQQLERTVDFVRENVAIEPPQHPLDARTYDRAADSAQQAVD
ncbi:MAG: hypothetical protein AAFY88_14655, partial [Acidobacteriota bacterium]